MRSSTGVQGLRNVRKPTRTVIFNSPFRTRSFVVQDVRVTNTDERVVYGVHAVRAREICATQYVTLSLKAAEEYAAVVSKDPGVLAAAVTRFVMDTEGQCRATAMYVSGERQQVPHCSDDRRVLANGHGAGSVYAPKL